MSGFPSLVDDADYDLQLPPGYRPAFKAASGESDTALTRLTDRLLQSTEALVFILDQDGCVLRMNEAGRQAGEFATSEVVGHKFWDVLANLQDRPMFRSVFRRAQQQREPVRVEAGFCTATQQERLVAWSLAAVTGPEGVCEVVVATGVDVTRRSRAEEQLRVLKQQINVQRLGDGYRDRRSDIVISDRRAQPRQPYPYYQLIAPVLDGQLPRRDQFQHLRCVDISPGGFSFTSPTPPTANAYVVALGNPPDLVYLQASVAHVRRLDDSGEQGYSVGCSYTGRVEC